MPDDIGPLAIWTLQHLRNHGTPTQNWWRSSSNKEYQINSSETPSKKHHSEARKCKIIASTRELVGLRVTVEEGEVRQVEGLLSLARTL
jgi:hypothetical protein